MTDRPTNAPQYDIDPPPRMRGLPRDHRGFLIPYFVEWMEGGYAVEPGHGTPDFRVSSPLRRTRCVKERRCWLCGQPMGRYLVFVLGPMCTITRTTMEPACHHDCATYAARVCPFMARPRMRRNDVDMPEGHWAPGFALTRNPGVLALWVTRGFKTFAPEQGGGWLISVGEPERIEWWREARPATRAEVLESIESGLPLLRANADREGPAARRALEETYVPRLTKVLPS
jgi:hypothetical protein